MNLSGPANSAGDDTVTIPFRVRIPGDPPQFAAVADRTWLIGQEYTLPLTATGLQPITITQRWENPVRQSTNDVDLPRGLGSWQAGLVVGNYVYFAQGSSNVLRAHDFDGGRQDTQDITLVYDTPSWNGGVATDTRIYMLDGSSPTAFAFDYSGQRQSAEDINLGVGVWEGAARSGDRLYFLDNDADVVRVYGTDRTRHQLEDMSLGDGNYRSIVVVDTLAYFATRGSTTVRAL